jgi:pimeloyl-ACP methyl ester carboxylesterase
MRKCKSFFVTFIVAVTLASNSKVYGMLYSPNLKFYFSETEFLNYRVIGNGEKTIIYLHGFGASNRTWDDIIPYLNVSDTKFIFFDLIGAGFSSKPKNADYSMRANALVIKSFIKQHDLSDYALVGHSFGGGVSLLVTLEFLESPAHRPSALVLLDAAAYKTKLPFFVDHLRVPLLSNVLLAITSPEFQAKYTLERLYFDKRKVTHDKVGRYSFFMSMEGQSNALIETARQIIPEDFARYVSQYRNIDIPALVLWGRQDTALPLEDGKRLSKEIPKAKLAIIEDCGHNVQEEQPKDVARLINGFLADLW